MPSSIFFVFLAQTFSIMKKDFLPTRQSIESPNSFSKSHQNINQFQNLKIPAASEIKTGSRDTRNDFGNDGIAPAITNTEIINPSTENLVSVLVIEKGSQFSSSDKNPDVIEQVSTQQPVENNLSNSGFAPSEIPNVSSIVPGPSLDGVNSEQSNKQDDSDSNELKGSSENKITDQISQTFINDKDFIISSDSHGESKTELETLNFTELDDQTYKSSINHPTSSSPSLSYSLDETLNVGNPSKSHEQTISDKDDFDETKSATMISLQSWTSTPLPTHPSDFPFLSSESSNEYSASSTKTSTSFETTEIISEIFTKTNSHSPDIYPSQTPSPSQSINDIDNDADIAFSRRPTPSEEEEDPYPTQPIPYIEVAYFIIFLFSMILIVLLWLLIRIIKRNRLLRENEERTEEPLLVPAEFF
ncbi:hypothetical protein TRFO_31059 [Tritrichomonas foetus]|uniref:Uncharacterized protein n=1 Tax=Tritrichomonas foetus TaxID=1144522 RepID=A0A1J4JSF3_9EUKA|nr:hypothetical protein TRFO_31059 [Tritrichomonas foetus]|eukprot:OHT01979.1 hypothetical protein TRFO_31059 [Tritrichomonas foetus]